MAVAVKNDRYRDMLKEFLFKNIEKKDIGNIGFQQDGASCHTAETTLIVLRPVSKHCFISRRADILFVGCRQRCFVSDEVLRGIGS